MDGSSRECQGLPQHTDERPAEATKEELNNEHAHLPWKKKKGEKQKDEPVAVLRRSSTNSGEEEKPF